MSKKQEDSGGSSFYDDRKFPIRSVEEILEEIDYSKDPKKLILDYLPSECKDVGEKYFDCLEQRISNNFPKKGSVGDIIDMLQLKLVPECEAEFSLESCLKNL